MPTYGDKPQAVPSSGLGLPRHVYQLGEGMAVIDSHLSQHLAIDLNACCLETVHKAAVGKASFPCRSVDAGDPQAAHVALARSPVSILVATSLQCRLVCRPPETASPILIPLGSAEYFLVSPTESRSALYSHDLFPFQSDGLLAALSCSLLVQGEESAPHQQA